jgi:DNA adenine methylase
LKKNKLLQPFLKWAGGKRQLLPTIRQYTPPKYGTYYEPFIGAGAVLFDMQPTVGVINDSNTELINCYEVIRDSIDELIINLRRHKNEKEYYYAIRDIDREPNFKNLDPIQRASRIIFLNKTCFNGLFRVNSAGQFNVPFGSYHNPKILNEIVLRAAHNYLATKNIQIMNVDFEQSVKSAAKGDFIYFDPPYDPVSDTSSFTGYDINGFGKREQVRLRDVYKKLSDQGCLVLLSNSATDFILDLYKDFTIITVTASRNINSVATGRGKIDEVLVMNYDCFNKK